ncbi:MAG TPA: SDR family oxidoreductase [Streptosporangiaceae bacterium]|nr:SDR family oxidoreductase [Streptosporangiaceae bacterium]
MHEEGPATSCLPRITDARIVVTGAVGLIGRKLTYRFAQAGAQVVAVDLDAARLRKEFGGVAHILPVPGDVADEVFADDLFTELASSGGITALVNNAALTGIRIPFLQTTTEMFEAMLATNLRSVYLLSHRAACAWTQTRTPGTIINLSSPGATRAHPAQSLYDASKGGVEALSRAMAVELGPFGIRVNCLAPAAVSEVADRNATLPLRTSVTPDDIADAAVFLVSPAANHITGVVLPVDGGLGAQLRVPNGPSSGQGAA